MGSGGEMVLNWILIFPRIAIIASVLALIFAAIFKEEEHEHVRQKEDEIELLL